MKRKQVLLRSWYLLVNQVMCLDLSTRSFGHSLKEIKGCALLPDTWKFTYGLGDDGREWTARFRTGVFQKECVGNAVGKASGFGNFGCAGSG